MYTAIYKKINQKKYNGMGIYEFKQDLINVHKLNDNPKADKAFDLAWDYGHAYGYGEVINYFEDLIQLIR